MATETENPASGRLRVLVVDDNKYMRDKVVQLLSSDFEVIGTAADGIGACEADRILNPSIVIIDISMPGLSGIDAVKQMKEARVDTKFVFLTVHDDVDFVRAALNAGGTGYVVKSQMAKDLMAAIRSAAEGNIFISPCIPFDA